MTRKTKERVSHTLIWSGIAVGAYLAFGPMAIIPVVLVFAGTTMLP